MGLTWRSFAVPSNSETPERVIVTPATSPYGRRIVIAPPARPDRAAPAPSTVELGILTVHVAIGDGSLSLILVGELDLAAANELPRLVHGPLTSGRVDQLVIDLAALTFMDSSGIRTLLDLERLARAQDCDFFLLRPQPAVLRVLEITSLLDHFRIER
jgi:stage II sporulation protein AA (anti-sigma F factor antagonist)